jgi:transketolase
MGSSFGVDPCELPGFLVVRPGDANEVSEAWRTIIPQRKHPAALVLTRQAIPTFDRTRYAPAAGVARGAYVLAAESAGRDPEVILIGTGSEVSLCVNAHEQLVAKGIRSRVVSMPSWELFERQEQAYRDSVLPPQVTARISVEQASTMGWDRYVGWKGRSIGMHTFGASAPLRDLQKRFGFTPEHLVSAAEELARPTGAGTTSAPKVRS